MLNDPIGITYETVNHSLVRNDQSAGRSLYRTSSGEFELEFDSLVLADGTIRHEVTLTRVEPDPTPADVFDNYRRIPVRFGLVYETDPNGFFSEDIPSIRTALLTLVDATLQGRILAGEK